jgi:hypothetical protein
VIVRRRRGENPIRTNDAPTADFLKNIINRYRLIVYVSIYADRAAGIGQTTLFLFNEAH